MHWFVIFNTKFIIFNTKPIIFNTKSIILNAKFIILIQVAENLQLIATVIYWVTRAAMSQAFPGLTALHSGDSVVLKQLARDKNQVHVLKELQRIGWIDEQRDFLVRTHRKSHHNLVSGDVFDRLVWVFSVR